jgi:hypothetical protein
MSVKRDALFLLLLFLAAAALYSTVAPYTFPFPDRDQGVYTYIAEHMLQGQIPYRDLWDHKGPLIYLIYALGLLIHPVYGIWLVGLVALCQAVFLSYRLVQEVFESNTALLVTALWLASLLAVIDGGGTVEFFNLPFQFAALLAVQRLFQTGRTKYAILIGAGTGLSFLLRPNGIAIGIAIVIFLVYRVLTQRDSFSRWAQPALWMSAGGLLVLLPVFIWLSVNGALDEFFDIVFRYNALYSQMARLKWLAILVGAGYVPVLVASAFAGAMVSAPGKSVTDAQKFWGGFLLLAAALEIMLSTLSGRVYRHYFVSWLPVLGMLAAPAIDLLEQGWRGRGARLVQAVSLAMLIWIAAQARVPREPLAVPPRRDDAVVRYVLENTSESDFVWFWGNEVKYNVWTGREAPTRLPYAYPLGTPGYATEELAASILDVLRARRPMIVDATPGDPLLPALTDAAWEADAVVWPLVRFIRENYELTGTIGPNKWLVWTYKGQ